MNPENLAVIRAKIRAHPKLDDADKAELLELLPTPVEEEGEEHNLGQELADVGRELRYVVRKLEARHPQFTEMADQVLHFLSRIGI